MKVIATAGHVDHGKSALVRALTGIEPDRWDEEKRRGLTIDLGFAWTQLQDETIALVDVPGHQRFVTNMLAGVGAVPAVLFVVAADEGWSRQSSEHLDALQALGITHSVLAVTKADLADDVQLTSVRAYAHDRLTRAGLEPRSAIAVSARTGTGLPALQAALHDLAAQLPAPVTDGRVRLWIDRVFTIKGAGTVVTGTLGSGTLQLGDELAVGDSRFSIRGLQQLETGVDRAEAVSRVAVNLRGSDRTGLHRGGALLTPGAWWLTDQADVLIDPLLGELTERQMVHIGSAAVPVRVRALGERAARLTFDRPLPLQVGDRAVLRDPGQQAVTAGVHVIDPDPPELGRRGDATRRGDDLSSGRAGTPPAQVERRGAIRAADLARLGFTRPTDTDGVHTIDGWLVHDATWQRWQHELTAAVTEQAKNDPQQPGLVPDAIRRELGVPDSELFAALVATIGLRTKDGRIGQPGVEQSLGRAAGAFDWLAERWRDEPLYAPERDELLERGLTTKDLATAERAGVAIRLAPDLVVAPTAIEFTLQHLAELDQPFTLSAARQHLGTTRRVAVPLLELMDRRGLTVRDDDARRRLTGP